MKSAEVVTIPRAAFFVRKRWFFLAALPFLTLLLLGIAQAAPNQIIEGYVPKAIAKINLQPIDRLPSSSRLTLGIGLPLRNQEALTNLLKQLYDPRSTNFHHFLKPEQFTEKFGPTKQDYQALIDFAEAHHLTIAKKHSNRALLMVNAAVADIEKTFHVKMQLYRHPTESRNFFAPDTEPSLDLTVPVLSIEGLNNFTRPHPMNLVTSSLQPNKAKPASGSGGGNYAGNDFRAAYVPGVNLTGVGQSIALVEFDGYFANDIAAYESSFGIAPVTLTNVYLDSETSSTAPGEDNIEVALDIEMAVSMAPGLDKVLVYEGDFPSHVLTQIADDNLADQISCSWTFDNGHHASIFQQMAMQGQAFFTASGDSGSYAGDIPPPADDPNVIVVGGTFLDTTGPGGSWISESVWNRANINDGSAATGGGISTVYAIPDWQEGIDMSANGGSTTMRNIPDVAMVAENVLIDYANGGQTGAGGTSCSTPLWAAFMALVNQKAVAAGQAPLGFVNPALYALAKSSNYTAFFHDVTTGNSTNSTDPTNFYAVAGYDLCTGWGTPTVALIDALVPTPPVILQQPTNQSVAAGGSANFSVGAAGAAMSYQWFFNNTNLAGATNDTLVFNPVQSANAGLYQVVITNFLGAATSAVATLSIPGNPVSLNAFQPGNIYTNGPFTFQLSGLTGQGMIIIQASTNFVDWFPIFTNAPGFGQLQFTDTNAGNYPREFYRAVIQPLP